MNIEYAVSPKWANAEHTAIDLNVKFLEFNDVVPFTATTNDSQPHTKELFNRALNGEYGDISEFATELVDTLNSNKNIIFQVEMRQMRLALLYRGILSSVNNAIDSISDEIQRNAIKIEWDYSMTVKINSQWFKTIASILLIENEDYDALFKEASTY